MIKSRFDEVDERFSQIDERFDGVDKRFDGIDRRLDGLEATMHHGFGELSGRLTSVERRTTVLESK